LHPVAALLRAGLIQALAAMIKFIGVGKLALAPVVLAVGAIFVAYGTPHLQADTCRDLAIQYLAQHPVQGRGLGLELVSAKPGDIAVYVTGPFASTAIYHVPNDLHTISYSHECGSYPHAVSLGPRKRSFTL